MAEVNPADLFPGAQSRPRSLDEALEDKAGSDLMPTVSERHQYPKLIRTVKPGQSLGKVYGKGFNWVRCHPNRPCPTIPKSTTYGGLGFLFLPDGSRSLSSRKLARCASYPDAFEFVGGYQDAAARIGNSVPPLFMAAVAGALREKLFGGYEMPDRNGRDYLETLEAAWHDHLAPREPDAPTVVSLFAGCGGSSLGYSMAGYRELLAVEWDANAVETFRLNFPGVPVWRGDIRDLSVGECLDLAGLEPGELDVLDGSPPCQGFSTAGKRQMGDERNRLYLEYVRLLRGLRPRAFVMENVSGLVKGKMKLVFADVTRALKASGYRVSCRLMNAMYFNVPQSRQRLIWIGMREDLAAEPNHPKAESRGISLKEAIGDLPQDEMIAHIQHVWIDEAEKNTKWWRGVQKVGPGRKIRPTGHYIRLEWGKVHPAITRPGIEGLAPYLSNQHCHPARNRTLSIRELARVGSFPDEFAFIEALKHGASRIGNSVPPLFMKAIAEHIKQEILTGLDPRLVE